TGKIAVANVVIRTRQHIAAVYAFDKFLILDTLRYANELRDPRQLKVPDSLKDANVKPNELTMAERLIDDMAIKWDPAQYHDTYRDDLLEMIHEKAQGKVREVPKARHAKEADVIDFASLLEKSLKARRGRAAARRTAQARGGEGYAAQVHRLQGRDEPPPCRLDIAQEEVHEDRQRDRP